MAIDQLRDFFIGRHIALKDEWLQKATEFIFSYKENTSDNDLCQLVYEQWKFSNIKESTLPSTVLSSLRDKTKIVTNDRLILQINSVVDIGSSLLSQFSKLAYDCTDNSNFGCVTDSDTEEKNIFKAKPKRMLFLSVTDGFIFFQAIEYSPIKELSIYTCPGCKILLRDEVLIRNNIFFLTEKNCQILGGDDEHLMSSNRPVELIAKKLKRDIKIASNFVKDKKKVEETVLSGSQSTPKMSNTNVFSRISLSSSRLEKKPVMPVKPLSDRRPPSTNVVDKRSLNAGRYSRPWKPIDFQFNRIAYFNHLYVGISCRFALSICLH
ncbi:hypothetical protein AB6A40_004705 [Gnathostoma spinigerum]|uniref:RecQ-mediated genome instability protein 1 n=1 Tax=Gnathostoma spinigerum TaxID=75299 RepID=A0ABD6EKQ1_9BILA